MLPPASSNSKLQSLNSGNQNSSSILSEPLIGHINSNQRGSHSPIQQATTKRKPPLPSPFLSKHDGSHSKLALYSQAQVQQAQLQALGNFQNQNNPSSLQDNSSQGNNSNNQNNHKLLGGGGFNKNQHHISQGQIPTASSGGGLSQQSNSN